MHLKWRFNLLLAWLLFFTYGYGQDTKTVDSLLLIIKNTDNDSVRMVSYSKLRRATIFSNPKIAQEYTFKYLEYAEKRKDSSHIGFANFYLANAYITQNNYENALKRLFKSVAYFEKQNDSIRLCSMYNTLGAVYENTQNDSLALTYFKKAYNIGTLIKDRRRSAIAASNLALIYNNNKKYDIGIPYLEKAVSNLKNSKYKEYYTSCAINLANAYRDTKRFNEALSIYNDIFSKIDTLNDIFNYGVILRGQSALNLKFNKPKKALNQLKVIL